MQIVGLSVERAIRPGEDERIVQEAVERLGIIDELGLPQSRLGGVQVVI